MQKIKINKMEFFGIDNLLYENYEKIPFEENLSDSFFLEYETTNSILEKKIQFKNIYMLLWKSISIKRKCMFTLSKYSFKKKTI